MALVVKQDKWICLDINEKYSTNRQYNLIYQELKDIFGNDLLDFLVVGEFIDDDNFHNILNNYVFVKCVNIYSKRNKLKKSKIIKNVLTDYENINFVSDEEIKLLKQDWLNKKKESEVNFYFGDVVKIKVGLYSKLFGIIINKIKDNYLVLFRLCCGFELANISKNNMEKVSNFFEYIKYPVLDKEMR